MNTQRRAETLDDLRDTGVVCVRATYSGSGDDGSVEEPTFHNVVDHETEFDPKHLLTIGKALVDRAFEVMEEALDEKFAGCFNNDGACGTITWTMIDDKIHIDHEWYVTSTEHEEADL